MRDRLPSSVLNGGGGTVGGCEGYFNPWSWCHAAVTVDWFHVVQLFTKAVDAVRKVERTLVRMSAATRWAVPEAADGKLTAKQAAALAELDAGDLLTSKAWRIKE